MGKTLVQRWETLELTRVTEMISRKVVAANRQMVAQVYVKKGAQIPRHRHPSEQTTYVLEGALRMLIDDEEVVVREGELVQIPSDVPHQAEALDDTFQLEFFSPARTDWL